MGDYTGNPILIETKAGTRLIYSKFENLTPNRIEWWQYCSLWSRSLDIIWLKGGLPQIQLGLPHQILVDEPGDEPNPPEGLGYLARCHPIWTSDGYLLPLYREHAPHFHGVILHSKNGVDWEYRGSIGKGEAPSIQPTIWYDRESNTHRALLRNFARSGKLMAYYSESSDEGATWSKLQHSKFYNANNSILALKGSKDQTLVVWNNDPTGRNNISLSAFDNEKPRLISKLDGYGSYPSACIDNGQLKIAYTVKANPLKTPGVRTAIKVKTYNLEAVIRSCRRDTAWEGFSQIYSS
jgi:hypothetical protein